MTAPIVDDVTTDEGDELYLVRPAEPGGPGVIWLHWYDESPTANRSQFLEEATDLAERGVTSVLPQLHFAWKSAPSDIESDLGRIAAEKTRLLAAHRRLLVCDGVDGSRIALVGHDFGAMHGMTLFGEVDLAASVLIAPTPRWSDWFVLFWPITTDRYDYMRALEPLDPITMVTRADFPVLFQFGKTDFFIAPMTGLELAQAAPEPKRMLSYDTGHAMEDDVIRDDRTGFLVESLGL